MPSSPVTPSRTRPRRPSNIDLSSSTSTAPYHASNGTRSSRRSSRTSQTSMPYSPMTPRQQLDTRKSASLSIASTGFYHASREDEVMGNLADELADAWGEDTGEEPGSSFLEGLREGSVDRSSLNNEICHGITLEHTRVPTVRSPTTPSWRSVADDSPTRLAGNVKRTTFKQHKRCEWRYNGSDDGDPSEMEEVEGVSPALVRQMADVEGLARRGLDDDSVSEAGGVIPRTTNALKDLGAQASIENGATRMITAYSSIASHRTNKTREMFSLAHSLRLDKFPTLSDEEIDHLTSELDLLIRYLPLPPGPSPLQSLQILIANTTDLAHSLRSLTDLLQESRQAASAASRRIKNARDSVMDLQQEEAVREEGIEYLEQGEWDRRIRGREAHSMCGEVVAGFETTCNVWRDRLFGTMTAAATPA